MTATATAQAIVTGALDELVSWWDTRIADQGRDAWRSGGRQREDVREARTYAVYLVGSVAYGQMSIDEARECAESAAADPEFRSALRIALTALTGA